MWNILISIFYFILNWLTLLFNDSENNEALIPIISNCDNYTPNTFLLNKECSYGFSGRFCDECGLVFKKPNVKIVGGIEADEGSWPSIAYILFTYKYRNKLNSSQILKVQGLCGGSLIDRQTVLTAGHCLMHEPFVDKYGNNITFEVNDLNPSFASMYTVYLGLYDKKKINESRSIKVDAKEIISHPLYNIDSRNENDIGIIKLKNEIKPSCDIQIACLPTPDFEVKEITDAYAAGWGLIDNNRTLPDILHNVKMKIYPNIRVNCFFLSPALADKQICAGSIKEEKDVCNGDSGGPLYVLEKVNGKVKYVVAGLVSYGPVPCGIKMPGIYTKISAYLDWIKENMN